MFKWDRRFMDMATLVSMWSKDPSTKCGAVIVDPMNRIVSVGHKVVAGVHKLYSQLNLFVQRVWHCVQHVES